ncbi:ArnT family glycosyltransferase [Nonomuraea guangzhouensis]|uniref:ArnT family glycosyltransferase n=1 Tax=Nonomuraea guangzhouensis TaxID=1291555 RepID=A0ABW4GDR5_9ACTN|nr:glycosyltransferase family 39 protein [Nonomuraea guangzhouensis]
MSTMTAQLLERPTSGRRAPADHRGDPRWARPAMWGVLALAAVLYTWALGQNGYANDYYSAAIYSGTQSWKAFFFGALDAGSYITVDKPPLALWVMGLSARLFGFGTWSMLLPQAVAGVAAVGLVHSAVRRTLTARPIGDGTGHLAHVAALIAALVMTLTPITVAINRDNNPDTILVLLLVAAAWFCLEAIRTGRTRTLLVTALLVGLAFNTKMLQAYLVLPAFAAVYLMAAPGRPLRRIGRLLAAGAVLVVSSGWWMAIVDLWPSGSRPYIGGSSDNTVWDLVVGYNGLGRIFGASAGSSGGGANFGGEAGATRLFNDTMAGQISWLIPFAALALAVGVALIGRRPRTDPGQAALLLWGGWLAIHFVVFSFSEGGFHPYYATAMAPAIAALTGMGAVLMWHAYRRSAAWRWALPLGIAVTGGWSFVVLRRTTDFVSWLPWVVAGATAVAVLGLLAVAFGAKRLAAVALVAGLFGGLAGPAAYAVTPLTSAVQGTNPTAGPAGSGGMGKMGGMGGGPGGTQQPTAGQRTGRPGGGGQVSTQLIAYLKANQGDATWLVAVDSAQSASSIILSTGKAVIAMGGFTGSDPAMTVAKLKGYVAAGTLKYILITDGRSSSVTEWVKANGTLVDASAYGGTDSSGQALYELG